MRQYRLIIFSHEVAGIKGMNGNPGVDERICLKIFWKKSVKIFFRVKNYCYICLTLKNKYSGEKGADDNIGFWPEKVSY